MQTADATAPPPVRPSVSGRTKSIAFFGAAITVIILDQITKGIVRGALDRGESWPDPDWILKIHYVTNSGAAFGILQGQTGFLVVMAFIGLAAIYLYYRNPPFDHWLASVAIGMMLGGAIGNLIDRIRLGRVTDYVDFLSYPSFNVADASISIGIAILVIGFILLGDHRETSHTSTAPNEDA